MLIAKTRRAISKRNMENEADSGESWVARYTYSMYQWVFEIT
jgi:hypothetical protein